jgi:excisionase family DNA binding protein
MGILGPKWEDRPTLTIEEAGEILGLSRWAAYEAANKGLLPTIRIGRRWIVPRHALEKLLDVSVPPAATS